MGYKVIIGKKTKRSGQKPATSKRLTVEDKYRWLKNHGYSEDQYSTNVETHFGQGPTVKEINDGYKFFKRQRR